MKGRFHDRVSNRVPLGRRISSRPILSIQLNDCVRLKLQDSSSDSQSNLDQRKEERELRCRALRRICECLFKILEVSSSPPGFATACAGAGPAPPPLDLTSNTDKTDPQSLPGPARPYCPRGTGIAQTPVPGPVVHRVTVAEPESRA